MTARVLVVDDEPVVEPLFRQQFRREMRPVHYRLDFGRSGETALHLLDGCTVLLLLDIDMPGMSRLDLLPKTKGREPGLPVFVISAYADTVSTARKRTADEFLTKPMNLANLRHDIMTVKADAMRRDA